MIAWETRSSGLGAEARLEAAPRVLPNLDFAAEERRSPLLMITSMLLITGSWIVLAGLLIGLGAATWRLCGASTPVHLSSAFFVGWAVWIGILQLLHFWIPMSEAAVSALLIALGGMGSIWSRRPLGARLGTALREHSLILFGLAVFALWLSNRSLGPLLAVDAGLYHLSSIQWASDYPLVTGLGNLHGRLAFNSAAFLWLSSLDSWPAMFRSFNVALGPLLLAAIARMALRTKAWSSGTEAPQATRVFHAALLLPLLYAAAVMHVSSTNPDWIVLILGGVLASELADLMGLDTDANPSGNFLAIAALCAAGIAVKLSFAALGGAVLAVATVQVLRLHSKHQRNALRDLLPGILLVLLLLIPWSLRSFEMSGYPAYPSTLFAVDVPWRVPEARVESELRWIRSWARAPGQSPDHVMGNADWIVPWFKDRLRSSDSVALLLFPLALSAWGLLWLGLRRTTVSSLKPPLIGPFAFAVLVWFAVAPDPRFLGSSLWACAAGLLAAMPRRGTAGDVSDLGRMIAGGGAALCTLGFLAFVGYMGSRVGGAYIRPGPSDGRYPVQRVQTEEFRTRSGLILNIPRKGDRCWEAQLPCTPFATPRLRLRIDGQLDSGYELEPLEASGRGAGA